MPTQTYTTPGSYTFTVPAGVTSLTIECWGGGGRGGLGSGGAGGGGGGGGAYAKKTSLSVTVGENLTVNVGAGATLVAVAGDTWVKDTFTVLAKAGSNGGGTVTGGAGGLSGSCVGDTLFSGGTGGDATDAGGGGGASSAGSASVGTNGGSTSSNIGGTGATAPLNGGNGGNGGDENASGVSGSNPGGGGGGSGAGVGTDPGLGGDGQVIINYSVADLPAPQSDSFDYFNEFIGNFGISSTTFSHSQMLDVLFALRPSGSILQNDTSIVAASDPNYLKIKILPPNSGTVYERIKFKPTPMDSHFVHLASGLTLDLRYDSITTTSGIMEVWLDASGLGYLNSNQRWWYSGPIGLPSGMDQLISVSKPSLYPIDVSNFNQFGNITIHVKYENQNNTHNELNIYSLKLCGDHAYSSLSFNHTSPLITIGGSDESGNIPLYTYGLARDSGNIPLFINGDAPTSGVIPLTIISAPTISTSGTLFIRGGIATNMNLFLKTYDPVGYSGNPLQLNIWGMTAGSGNLFGLIPLYTDGTASPSGAMNLFIGGYEEPISITTNMNLFLRAVGEYDSNGNVVYGKTNELPLIIYNNTISSGMSLYLETQSSLPYSGNMNLVMWRQYEGLSSVTPLILVGPSGINEDLTLYLQGQPNWRDSVTMFISGVVEQTGSMTLYNHGF